MDGKYTVSFSDVRSLAIVCHALDLQFDTLFNSETICGSTIRITEAYNRLLHTNLLNLAIAIRVSMDGTSEYTSESSGVMACGLFEHLGTNNNGRFSIKDVCDKIIHAKKIIKHPVPGTTGLCCTLEGVYKKSQWKLDFSPGIFCETLLQILESLEAK